MSTKLNAEELAAKRRHGSLWSDEMERAYAAAIREVAQPIADQRDGLLALVQKVAAIQPATSGADAIALCSELELLQVELHAAISKCTTP